MALMEPFTFNSFPSHQPSDSIGDDLIDLATSAEQQQQRDSTLIKKAPPSNPILPNPMHNTILPTLYEFKKEPPSANQSVQGPQSSILRENLSPSRLHPLNETNTPIPRYSVDTELFLSNSRFQMLPTLEKIPSLSNINRVAIVQPIPPYSVSSQQTSSQSISSQTLSDTTTHLAANKQTSSTIIQPTVMYRNLFHSVECQLPLTDSGVCPWEGVRVFIDSSVGYAGNAKLFKHLPDKGERALILNCKVFDPNRRELTQCDSCREYFDTRSYFKANPHIRGRIVLIKNNNFIVVEHGTFCVNLKYMCCCKHHGVSSYILSLVVTDNLTGNTVASALYPIYVKQWRKSTQKKQSCTIIFS
jgi:hypothetical protein